MNILPDRPQRDNQPLDFSNLADVQHKARIMMFAACRLVGLDMLDKRHHFDDMLQESLLALYQYQHQPVPKACAQAKYAVVRYIYSNIYRVPRQGNNPKYRKLYSTSNFLDWGSSGSELTDPEEWFRVPGSELRPVERQAFRKEPEYYLEVSDAFWNKVERQFLNIIIGMKKQWRAEALYHAARVLVLSCRGHDIDEIVDELDLDQEYVKDILYHHRSKIEELLASGPLAVGTAMARGELSVYYHYELTPEIINSGQRFVVIYPHGAFSVYATWQRASNAQYCRLQANRRINGKTHGCGVQLGRLGTVTKEALYKGSLKLQRKTQRLLEQARITIAS